MLNTLFQDQRKYLNRFFDQIDPSQAERVLHHLIACKGVILFSGVGKSGHIAEKISTTFSSTGTRALFLSPNNALHGDIGFVKEGDILVALSKSGNSQELIDLIPHAKKRGAFTISIVSAIHSKMEKISDFTMHLPVEREICPYDLAPTTSAAAQLIFGDCLAIALMQSKQFSVNDFAANHPGGALGRKITFKVSDLMLRGDDLPRCRPQDALIDALHELSTKKCGCLLIADEENYLKGIFTDGDLRRTIEKMGPNSLCMPLSALMTGSPKSTKPDSLAFEAIKTMEEDQTRLITVLPVLEQGKVVGLIRMHDILQKEL